MTKAFDIPALDESLKRDFNNGLISIKEAAKEFYRANWSMTVDIEYTKKKLGVK